MKLVIGVEVLWDEEQDVYSVRYHYADVVGKPRVVGSLPTAVSEAQAALQKFAELPETEVQ